MMDEHEIAVLHQLNGHLSELFKLDSDCAVDPYIQEAIKRGVLAGTFYETRLATVVVACHGLSEGDAVNLSRYWSKQRKRREDLGGQLSAVLNDLLPLIEGDFERNEDNGIENQPLHDLLEHGKAMRELLKAYVPSERFKPRGGNKTSHRARGFFRDFRKWWDLNAACPDDGLRNNLAEALWEDCGGTVPGGYPPGAFARYHIEKQR